MSRKQQPVRDEQYEKDVQNELERELDGTPEEYEVGYRKPPKQTQFKKGNKSGKGRPKGSQNLSTLVRKAFEVKVPAKINGEQTKMTKVELSLHQLANKAIAGDLKAIAKVLELYQQHGPQESAEVSAEMSGYALDSIIHYLRVKRILPWDSDGAENEGEGDRRHG